MTRPVRIAVVMGILVLISSWALAVDAQTAGARPPDPKTVDPQAAIKAAAAAFRQAQPIQNYRPAKTAWGDPDVSGYFLVATYTPLQRPERFKDKPFFTEDEAIAELSRVITADARVDPKDVHYDWK